DKRPTAKAVTRRIHTRWFFNGPAADAQDTPGLSNSRASRGRWRGAFRRRIASGLSQDSRPVLEFPFIGEAEGKAQLTPGYVRSLRHAKLAGQVQQTWLSRGRSTP